MTSMRLLLLAGAAIAIYGVAKNFTLIKNVLSNKKAINMKTTESIANGSFHTFKMKSLDGKEIDLSRYAGKKVVVINTASKCGYTPQYKDWQAFHEKYGDKIAVLGFPANNFGRQEPGSNRDIAEFCEINYGVTFQLFEKIDVIGENQHPLFQWLSKKELNGWNDKAPTWNFCKYVIDQKGNVTHFFASGIKPDNAEFQKAVGI